jgi:hypothetical protein
LRSSPHQVSADQLLEQLARPAIARLEAKRGEELRPADATIATRGAELDLLENKLLAGRKLAVSRPPGA